MPAPSIFAVVRHVLSRALRETGQALDRLGVRGVVHARQGRRMGPDDPYWFHDHLSRHRAIMGLLRRGEPRVPGITAGENYMLPKLSEGRAKEQGVSFLAPCATLIGNVHLGPHASVFYKAVLKADVAAHGINTIRSAKEEEQWKSLAVGSHARKQDAGLFDIGNGIGHSTIGGKNGGGIYVGEGTNIQDACVVTSYEGHADIGKYVTVGHSAQIHSASVGDESLIGMGSVLKPGCVVESQSFVAAGAVLERGDVVKSGEIWGGNPARKLRDLTAEERGRLRSQAKQYIAVGGSHKHCMELGGNVPDSLLEHELLGAGDGAASEAPSIAEPLPRSNVETASPAKEELDGAKVNGEAIEPQSSAEQDEQTEQYQEEAQTHAPKQETHTVSTVSSTPVSSQRHGDLTLLTVPELKDMLRSRGLKVGGKKAELIERLGNTDAEEDTKVYAQQTQ
ncbi:hypothetical protein ACHAXT_009996 [Thalassiosira profunda]